MCHYKSAHHVMEPFFTCLFHVYHLLNFSNVEEVTVMDNGNFDENFFQQGAAQEPPFFFHEINQ